MDVYPFLIDAISESVGCYATGPKAGELGR